MNFYMLISQKKIKHVFTVVEIIPHETPGAAMISAMLNGNNLVQARLGLNYKLINA